MTQPGSPTWPVGDLGAAVYISMLLMLMVLLRCDAMPLRRRFSRRRPGWPSWRPRRSSARTCRSPWPSSSPCSRPSSSACWSPSHGSWCSSRRPSGLAGLLATDPVHQGAAPGGEVDVLLVEVVDGLVELGDVVADQRLDAAREGLRLLLPRYSVSTAAFELRKSSVSSATAAALSGLAIRCRPPSVSCAGPAPSGDGRSRPLTARTPRRRRAGRGGRARNRAVWLALLHLRGPPACAGPSTTPCGAATGGLWQGRERTSMNGPPANRSVSDGVGVEDLLGGRGGDPDLLTPPPVDPGDRGASPGRSASARTRRGRPARVDPQLELQRADARRRHHAVLRPKGGSRRPGGRAQVHSRAVLAGGHAIDGRRADQLDAARGQGAGEALAPGRTPRICSATGRSSRRVGLGGLRDPGQGLPRGSAFRGRQGG